MDILLANLVIIAGAILQAAVGIGGGLIIVPLLALISVDFLPGPLMLASCVLWVLMASSPNARVDYTFIGRLFFGMIIGIVVGALTLARIDVHYLGILIGVLTLFGVSASLIKGSIKKSPSRMFGAGLVFGYTGSAAGIGAPFIPLLYGDADPRILRKTLGVLYLSGCLMIIAALWYVETFFFIDLLLAFQLIPGFIMGYVISIPIANRLKVCELRVIVLTVASISGVILIAQHLSAIHGG